MSVEANMRCVRCVTRVPIGCNFCDDCLPAVAKFRARRLCWHCAEDLGSDFHNQDEDFCLRCGADLWQSDEIPAVDGMTHEQRAEVLFSALVPFDRQ